MRLAAAVTHVKSNGLTSLVLFFGCVLFFRSVNDCFAQQQSSIAPQKTASSARIRSLAPNVAVIASVPLTIHLHGALTELSKVTITSCDQTRTDLAVAKHGQGNFTVELPATLLSKPCVLRVSTEFGSDLPLAVGDPQSAKLSVPAYDLDADPGWGGIFNHVFGAVQIAEPNPNDSIVGINFMNPGLSPMFVLGKNHTALFRLKALPQKNNDENDKTTMTLLLPGVHEADVQWGPKDKEDFWLGTLSDDGSRLLYRKRLSDMAIEPSGSLAE